MARKPLTVDSLVRHPSGEVMSLKQFVAGGHGKMTVSENFSASGKGKPRRAHFVDYQPSEEDRIIDAIAGTKRHDSGFQVPARVWKELHQHLPPEKEDFGHDKVASEADLAHLFNDRRAR